jgi:hypothetical protein
MTMDLQDEEIAALISMPKFSTEGNAIFDAPTPGRKLEIKLASRIDRSKKFTLSIAEGAHSSVITLKICPARKTTMQTRCLTYPLVRVDIDEKAIHSNPDGTIIKGSHVHIARAGYGDRFAYPFDSSEAKMVAGEVPEVQYVFESFKGYCHIESRLGINWTLGV